MAYSTLRVRKAYTPIVLNIIVLFIWNLLANSFSPSTKPLTIKSLDKITLNVYYIKTNFYKFIYYMIISLRYDELLIT